MTVHEMMKKIAEVEREKGVFIYVKYDIYTDTYNFSIEKGEQKGKRGIIGHVLTNEIVTWNIDILEDYLNKLADELLSGVIS